MIRKLCCISSDQQNWLVGWKLMDPLNVTVVLFQLCGIVICRDLDMLTTSFEGFIASLRINRIGWKLTNSFSVTIVLFQSCGVMILTC